MCNIEIRFVSGLEHILLAGGGGGGGAIFRPEILHPGAVKRLKLKRNLSK